MDPPGSDPTRWAILIGVGVTISRKSKDSEARVSDRSLQGAVNDIQSMEKYLESRPFAVNTTRLTATKSKDSPLKSAESFDQLPTLDNVVSALKKVLKTSKQNDHVYIHYSGHGSCRAMDGAIALELVNPLTLETEYLYGTVLRSAINKMIEKGLTVTLVLDCCFSGSVLRDDRPDVGNIRYTEHHTDFDTSFDNPFGDTDPEELRDGVVTFSRLLDPQGYTIITACGPHEVASELKFEGGATSGALTYFLINSLVLLSRRGTKVSNEMLHQHLRAQFHARLPDQTPMLYGRRGFAFFGDFSDDIRQVVAPTVSMHRSMEDGCLILHAGQAHGVHKNDEYALAPFDRSTNPRDRDSVRSRVYEVDCLSSKMETVDPVNKAGIARGSTWEATLLTSFSRRKIQICLDLDKSVCAALIQAASATTYLGLCHKSTTDRMKTPVSYVVKRTLKDYEIRDLTAKHACVVAKVPYDPKSSGPLFDALDHISRFKFFEGLENRISSSALERSFSLHYSERPSPDGSFHIKHEQTLSIIMKNLSNRTLYLGVYLFTEFWEIRNLMSESGEDAYLTIKPKGHKESGTQELPFTMTVPKRASDQGLSGTEYIVKLFITSRPFVFPGMVLPKLQHGRNREAADPLDCLLQGLNGDLPGNRGDEKCEWTTRNYLIRTYL
ncbi:uncharacterized protein FTJAE_5734 [Fusarium tjaetaba]|uniref:Peptidase C14 caspase domain-containing protein n=1 Tax=Fusarium tjaetaba TaxID=1567544 RepID=A0A8H5RQF8_9HYPO|nr:uncharacterized protein FTJAE_5734 [Fusarium tjaetaba]KAF5637319.1 hypothetical protein FTJAE_5734 [Fusarium tjaetaba]